VEYRVLATNKTSTMEEEIRAAATDGFRFAAVMGGDTVGGSEVVVLMTRKPDQKGEERFEYSLLATSKTSTMQKELQDAADAGFMYRGQTVFKTTFGGEEVVVILERSTTQPASSWECLLLGTKKTSTMQKELTAAGEQGFELVGLTVASTTFGGNELVAILRRAVAE
jgi:hypothetical protein